ncbi:MAG: endonuclease/exonuclease/phosphatase family protein [Actinomycetota bacterium]
MLLAGVALVLVIRWGDVTSPTAVAIAGLTLFAGVPLAMAGLLAVIGRSRVLRTSWVGILAVYLVTVSPLDAVVGCGAEQADAAVRVLTANVLRSADDVSGVAGMVANSGADIVILQEVSPTLWRALAADPRLDHLTYRSLDVEPVAVDPSATLVLVMTSLEVRSSQLHGLGARGGVDLEVALPGDGRTVTVSGVHLNAPVRDVAIGSWRDQLAALAARPVDRPGLIAGDFNATEDHRPFRTLLDAGWTDVHDPKGCGFDLTFPVDGSLPVPVMRLDHVLVTDHFEVLGVDLLDDANESDHRPVLADVRLRSASRG